MPAERGREISIAVFLLAVAVLLAIVQPSFFTATNLGNLSVNSSYIAVASLGMMIAVLTGNPDISVGSILAVAAMSAGHLAKAGVPPLLVIAAAVAIGAGLGFVNGTLVTRLRVHSIIVTLGTLGIYRGALLYVTGSAWVYDLPAGYRSIALGRLLGVPNPIWIAVVTLLIGAVVLRMTTWGRSLYAVGSNPEAARLAGLRPGRIVVSAMTVNGALVGLAAVMATARLSTIQSNVGNGFEFLAITAVVVGGVHIFGGSGTVLGMALGTILVGITGTVLVFLNISAFWEQTLQGLFILFAITAGVVTQHARRLRRARGAAPA